MLVSSPLGTLPSKCDFWWALSVVAALNYQPSKFACLQGKICDSVKGAKPRPLGRNIAFGDVIQGGALGF